MRLEGFFADFLSANAYGLIDGGDEDLAVADLAGAGGFDDCGLDAGDEIIGEDDLDLDLGQEIDRVFAAAINLGMALLASKALDFRDRESLYPDACKGFLNFLEFERLDDGVDFFHAVISVAFDTSNRESRVNRKLKKLPKNLLNYF